MPFRVTTGIGRSPSRDEITATRLTTAGSPGVAALTRRASRAMRMPSIAMKHRLPAAHTPSSQNRDSTLTRVLRSLDLVAGTGSSGFDSGAIGAPGVRSCSATMCDPLTWVIDRSSTRTSSVASPNGSGTAHGHTTSGGVTNFTSTITQSACRATGPIRVKRHTIATSPARAAVTTMF